MLSRFPKKQPVYLVEVGGISIVLGGQERFGSFFQNDSLGIFFKSDGRLEYSYGTLSSTC